MIMPKCYNARFNWSAAIDMCGADLGAGVRLTSAA
jgi:hypothetical protein